MDYRIFAAISESVPAFGMFGTSAGLVQMLSNMTDPNNISPVMIAAFDVE